MFGRWRKSRCDRSQTARRRKSRHRIMGYVGEKSGKPVGYMHRIPPALESMPGVAETKSWKGD